MFSKNLVSRLATMTDHVRSELHQMYAAALVDSGFLKEAICQYKRLLIWHAYDNDLYTQLGKCYFMLGKTLKSYKSYVKAYELSKNCPSAHLLYGFGLLFFRVQEFSRCEILFKDIIRHHPEFIQTHVVYLKLGIIYKKTNRANRAISYLRQYVQKVVKYPELLIEGLCQIAKCIEIEGHVDTALSLYHEAYLVLSSVKSTACLA